MANGQELNEDDVEAFITKLKASDNDKKVDQIQLFSLRLDGVSQLPVPTLDALTLVISPLLKTPHHLLLSSTLSLLPTYLPFLPASPPTHLRLALQLLFPPLLERLSDPKDSLRASAASSVSILGRRCYDAEGLTASAGGGGTGGGGKGKEKEGLLSIWEAGVREGALGGKGWRGKVQGMRVIEALRAEVGGGMPLKPWLAPLVGLLEDGDQNVRDQARETVVALLSPASTPPAARSELKKLLLARNVRKTIADSILTRVLGGEGDPSDGAGGGDPSEMPAGGTVTGGHAGITGGTRSGAATPLGGSAADEVDVVYVASSRDLDGEFAAMVPHFQGKETEHNWLPREKSIVRVRGMLRGKADKKYPEAFISGLKSGFVEGVCRTLASLRTTVAQQSCLLVQELAEHLGSAFDPFVEGLLVVLGKMAGFTKKIIAEKSQRSLAAIIIHTTCHPRIFISHISSGIAEKNVQTRHHCTAHLKTFLDMHGQNSKSTIESGSGLLDQLEGGVRKGLADVNPQVRDLARLAFWSFHRIWTSRAVTIMNGLDGPARKQLEKANPNEPNGSIQPKSTAAAAPSDDKPVNRRATSAMSQMLAEKRRQKAAELAATRAAQDSPRVVSNPIPASPSVMQGPSSTNAPAASARRTTIAPLGRAVTSPEGSPISRNGGVRGGSTSGSPSLQSKGLASPQDLLERSRSSNASRSLSRSPPSSSPRGSPSLRTTPLRQTSTLSSSSTAASRARSPISSGSTSHPLRTPTFSRQPLPSFGSSPVPVGLGVRSDGEEPGGDLLNWKASLPAVSSDEARPVDEALMTQAQHAEQAAQLLLDFDGDDDDDDDDDHLPAQPITPARPAGSASHLTPVVLGNGNGNGNGYLTPNMLRTPMNHLSLGAGGESGRAWEDSPRPEAMTPLLMQRFRERKGGRSWWVKVRECDEQATPLKRPSTDRSTPAEAEDDLTSYIEGLASGSPDVRDLQKLGLFSEAHPIPAVGDGVDEDDVADAKEVWERGKVFQRILDGLLAVLRPETDTAVLDQAMWLLFRLVEQQWALFDGMEMALCEALFRLRSSQSREILESTSVLLSILTDVVDPLYLLGVLRSSLEAYLSGHADERHRASGFLFGLLGMGMCILRLPAEVIVIEAPRLSHLIYEANGMADSVSRQAAMLVLLAVQAVLGELDPDAQRTLALFPGLSDEKKDFAMFLFERNGLLGRARGGGGEGDGKEREARRRSVLGEMEGLMGRAGTS